MIVLRSRKLSGITKPRAKRSSVTGRQPALRKVAKTRAEDHNLSCRAQSSMRKQTVFEYSLDLHAPIQAYQRQYPSHNYSRIHHAPIPRVKETRPMLGQGSRSQSIELRERPDPATQNTDHRCITRIRMTTSMAALHKEAHLEVGPQALHASSRAVSGRG